MLVYDIIASLLVVVIVLNGGIGGVLASTPDCAVLFCGDGFVCNQRTAGIWLAAAQEEALRHWNTVNGAYLDRKCTGERSDWFVPEVKFSTHELLCLDTDDIPEQECATKLCDYERHTELYENDCPEANTPNTTTVCRTVHSWQTIANNKLQNALRSVEIAEGADGTLSAISSACAADFIYKFINDWLVRTQPSNTLHFITDHAREVQKVAHINSKARVGTLLPTGNTIGFRVSQASLTCWDKSKPKHQHAPAPEISSENATQTAPGDLINLQNFVDSVTRGAGIRTIIISVQTVNLTWDDTPGAQLLTDFAGVLSRFQSTVSDEHVPDDSCGEVADQDSGLPSFDATKRLFGLTVKDFAVVHELGPEVPVENEDRKEVRRYNDLTPASERASPVLVDLFKTERNESTLLHLQLQHDRAPEQPDEISEFFESSIVLRVQNELTCEDQPDTLWEDLVSNVGVGSAEPSIGIFSVNFRAPPADIPLTLAPDSSVCLNGERNGQPCTVSSECARGWACKRKPFSPHNVAFCYDGEQWDESQPCAFADHDDECPFGECIGEVNGLGGGAYPLYYFYRQYQCQRAHTVSPICDDERVQNWQLYPNALAFTAAQQ